MTPGKIAGATRALGAPSDWNAARDGECETLAIRDRSGTMESAWYPSEEEKAAIAAGRPVILTIWGNAHPPVSVNVELPAAEIDITSLDDDRRRLLDPVTGSVRDGGPRL